MSSCVLQGAVALGLFAAPRIASYMCLRPEENSNSYIDTFRRNLNHAYEGFTNFVGKERWETFSGIILDNFWVGYLVCPTLRSYTFNATQALNLGPAAMGLANIALPILGSLSAMFVVWKVSQWMFSEPQRQRLDFQAYPLNLVEWPIIPPQVSCDSDPILNRNCQCAISQSIARYPVIDPTNNVTVYDLVNITRWVREHGTSPTTRQPLAEYQLRVDERLLNMVNGYLRDMSSKINRERARQRGEQEMLLID